MKKIEKLNLTTKMLLVLVYSFVLLLIAAFIINIGNAEDETKGYGTKARDQYIQLYTKVIEIRTEPKESDAATKKESLQSSIYTQIVQLTDTEVKNIELFVKAETKDGTTIYYEETKKASNSTYKGLPNTNASYFETSPSGLNKQNTYVSSSNSYKKTDTTPKIVYMDVYYDVVLETKEVVRKQLKYYFVPTNPETEKFDKYENAGTLTNKNQFTVDVKELNDYLSIKLKYTLSDPEAQNASAINDNFEITLSANESKFAAVGKYVVDSKIALYAKGKNHSTDTENYFSDYILISENVGVLVDKANTYLKDSYKNSLTNTYLRNTNIGSSYEVSELYLSISVTLNTGETIEVFEKFNITR